MSTFKSFNPKKYSTKSRNNWISQYKSINELCAICGYPNAVHEGMTNDCPERDDPSITSIIPYTKPKVTKWNKRQIRINKFDKFLLDNDCFVEYRDNVRNSSFNASLTKLFNEPIDKWVSYAFYWSGTKEGSDYWSILAVEWDTYCETEGIE
jgi:hypothetical protein